MDIAGIPLVWIGLFLAGMLTGYLMRGSLARRAPEHRLSLQAWTRETVSDPQLEAAAALGAARGARAMVLPHLGVLDHERLGQLARLVSSIVKLWRRYPGRPRVVLWIDDEPISNTLEQLAFTAMGITTVAVPNSEAAFTALASQRFAAIVSDLRRGKDGLAGFTLLEALRQRGVTIPFIMYSSTATPTQRQDIKRRGAMDCTDDPQELVRLVNQAILISLSRDTD